MRLFWDPLRLLPRLHREYGDVAALSRGDPSLVCAFGPAHNQQLLPRARQFEHFGEVPIRVPEGSALAHMQVSLVTANGEAHRRLRRLMMPSFTRTVIQGYRDDMVAVAERHLGRWQAGATIDVVRAMTELALDTSVKCLFGLDAGDGGLELGRMGEQFLQRVIDPATALLPIDLPWLPYGRLLRLCERFERRLLDMAHERRRSPQTGHDVLSRLIEAHDEDGSRLSDVELLGNMGLLFVAGHETTAYALAWILMLLALHPPVFVELRDELRAELSGDAPTVEQLARLPLLDGVVKEGLRLLPPTYITFIRRATEPFELGPYRMPEGSMVVLSPLVTHHMPEVYRQPDRFEPRRWAQGKRSPFEYLPFGVGPRLCLGATFAEQEIRIVLALIVQRFGLRIADGFSVDVKARGMTLGPSGAMPITMTSPEASVGTPPELTGSVREFVTC